MAYNMRMRLVLFDIDGTLISTGGAGTRALTAALSETLRIRDAFAGIRMAGMTDPRIIAEALRRRGITADGLMPRLLESYVRHLAREMAVSNGRCVMPGVADVLTGLRSVPGTAAGLLTGNVAEGARIKLDALGLSGYFLLDGLSRELFGAFGSDSEDRNLLLPYALDRYRKLTGVAVKPEDCIVVGDTPRDVQCARRYGTRAVAVATGPYSLEELRKTGAHLALPDLSGHREFLRTLSSW
jgi:phosphoglycolate phosphatase